MVAQLPGELVHDFLEDDGVNVLAKHVEEEPVSHLGLFDDDVNALLLDQSEPDVEKVGTHAWTEDDHGAIDTDKPR